MSTVNPYTAPRSEVAETDEGAAGEVRIFAASGRIGRVRYLAYTLGAYLLVALIARVIYGIAVVSLGTQPQVAIALNMGLSTTVAFGFLGYSFLPTIQRLHDVGSAGWLSLLTLVPGVNVILYIVLCVMPGTKGRNRFGPPPPPNTNGVTAVTIVGGLILVIAIAGITAAIAIPAYEGYHHRAPLEYQSRPHAPAPPSER